MFFILKPLRRIRHGSGLEWCGETPQTIFKSSPMYLQAQSVVGCPSEFNLSIVKYAFFPSCCLAKLRSCWDLSGRIVSKTILAYQWCDYMFSELLLWKTKTPGRAKELPLFCFWIKNLHKTVLGHSITNR